MRTLMAFFLLSLACTPSIIQAQALGGSPLERVQLDSLHAQLRGRFGLVAMQLSTSDAGKKLDLTLSDGRFRGLKLDFVDSARVVARFAAANLPPGYRPDSIGISIVTADTGSGATRYTQTSKQSFALAKLGQR